jgi:translocator protein
MTTRRQSWAPVLAGAIAATVIAGLGAAMTDLGPWYQGLRKPEWQPPDWLFGPAWTLIFALAALSFVAAWRAAPDRRSRAWIVGLFALNGLFNVLWSAFFFRLRRPDWALLEVCLLWLSILMLIVALARVSRLASRLLIPYLAWVTLAALLNLAVVRLNYPFQEP